MNKNAALACDRQVRCLLLILCLLGPAAWRPALAAGPGYRQEMNVLYGEAHGVGLLMDVFVPTAKTNGLALVDVVSGTWNSHRDRLKEHQLMGIYSVLAGQGYTVFAVRPGSKPRFAIPDMVENVETAIRFVKSRAADYHVDPERIGLTGASAGGHLAVLTALQPKPGRPSAKNPVDRSGTAVAAVGVFFPPTDFVDWRAGETNAAAPHRASMLFQEDNRLPKTPEQFQQFIAPLLFPGGTAGHPSEEVAARIREISPLQQVKARPAAPFLLIHGDADTVVPLNHSQRLAKAIESTGGDVTLLVKQGGGHPWLTLSEEVRVLGEWFEKKLGAPGK